MRSLLIAVTLLSTMAVFADDTPQAVANAATTEAAEIAPAETVPVIAAPPFTPRMNVTVEPVVEEPTPTATEPPSCTTRRSHRFRIALVKVLAELGRVVARAQ
jgi:hypothetical protein